MLSHSKKSYFSTITINNKIYTPICFIGIVYFSKTMLGKVSAYPEVIYVTNPNGGGLSA